MELLLHLLETLLFIEIRPHYPKFGSCLFHLYCTNLLVLAVYSAYFPFFLTNRKLKAAKFLFQFGILLS